MSCTFLLPVLVLLHQAVPDRAPGPAPVSEFTVLAFNILTDGNPPGPDAASPLYRDSRRPRIVEIIHEHAPDVVLLQEAGGGGAVHALLAELDPRWRMKGDGDRGQTTLARHPLKSLGPNTAEVELPFGPVVVHNVHWEPYPYGPYECQDRLIESRPLDARELLAASDKGEVYARTYRAVHPALDRGVPVVVGGDFNEPSHLDWTPGYLERGADRWVGNPTGRPLKAVVPWKGSRLLSDPDSFGEELALGSDEPLPPLRDAFRLLRPDPVADPGHTWTPAYALATTSRRPYRAREDGAAGSDPRSAVLDRIDRVYASRNLRPISAQVLGDTGGAGTDLGYDPWPSDHRAVLVRFVVVSPESSDAPD